MSKPVEFSASQAVGVVESVSPSEIMVRLENSAPQASAFNAGHYQRFPRINGWLLIPSEAGFLIGTVTWVGIERAAPIRGGVASSSMVELPFPLRRLRLTPLGTLRWRMDENGKRRPDVVRGILSYPSVGEAVLLPTADQLRAIAQTGDDGSRVQIGTSPLGGDVEVFVDPDRLFGRHLAILGNTGSGKSCTVAGLIRWSLKAAASNVQGNSADIATPNARFIVLDPNGEYTTCFDDIADVRVFRPESHSSTNQNPLTVPGWLWTSSEWSAITRASPQTQRPLLQLTLRNLRNQVDVASGDIDLLGQQLRGFASLFRTWRSDTATLARFPTTKAITTVLGSIRYIDDANNGFELPALQALGEVVTPIHQPRTGQYMDNYSLQEVETVLEALETALLAWPSDGFTTNFHEDMPKAFPVGDLAHHMEALSESAVLGGTAGYTASLVMRVKTLLADERMRAVIAPDQVEGLADWLADVIGEADGSNGQVAVIDLSLVSSEVIHTVVSVLGRVIMEALQHARRVQGYEHPTVLVLEEAHTFVAASTASVDVPTTADLCRQTFDRIAREGRKYGLGLVLSSQRPSELSQTVLSQCNTFLLHRLVNDRDQQLVAKMVPDALNDLVAELPAMPSGQAILLGWATPVPVLVQMTQLSPDQQPHSADPQFWRTWTRQRTVNFTWPGVVAEWLGASESPNAVESPINDPPPF
jgi:uncharacterized protein